jgi:hypothetical protein
MLFSLKGTTMKSVLAGLASLALLFGAAGRAHADLIITTDQSKFVSNDTAPWVVSNVSSFNSYSTTSGKGTFSWSFQTFADPFNGSNVIVDTIGGRLGVGATSQGPGSASYVVNAGIAYKDRTVLAIGFLLTNVFPATQFTVFDALGHSQTFTLDDSAGGYLMDLPGDHNGVGGFVGILSTVNITGFQFTEAVSSKTASVGAGFDVYPVQINTAPTPEPSGLVLLLAGCGALGVGSRLKRWRYSPPGSGTRPCGWEDAQAQGQA